MTVLRGIGRVGVTLCQVCRFVRQLHPPIRWSAILAEVGALGISHQTDYPAVALLSIDFGRSEDLGRPFSMFREVLESKYCVLPRRLPNLTQGHNFLGDLVWH